MPLSLSILSTGKDTYKPFHGLWLSSSPICCTSLCSPLLNVYLIFLLPGFDSTRCILRKNPQHLLHNILTPMFLTNLKNMAKTRLNFLCSRVFTSKSWTLSCSTMVFTRGHGLLEGNCCRSSALVQNMRYNILFYFGFAILIPGQILQSIAFVFILFLVSSLQTHPLEVYKTFVLEEKHGFNKTTPIIFVTDILKGWLVAFALGAPFLAAFLHIFNWAGERFVPWLMAFLYVSFVAFQLLLKPEIGYPSRC